VKTMTVVGARPQFIKAAVVSRAIKKQNSVEFNAPIKEIIVHTGQHYDANMSDVFFKEMKIPQPDYHLEMGGGNHGAMTGRMLEALEKLMLEEKPDLIIVYGDTNSTLAGALAAAKINVPVAHVEAGLRSFNMHMPEEINRILTDRVSSWLFCPTETAIRNLEREGVSNWSGAQVNNIGDVMYDAALFYREQAVPTPEISKLIDGCRKGFYLATVHRQENTDDPQRLKNIIFALEEIAERVPVVLPLHPRTRKNISALGLEMKQVSCIEPVGYFDMLCLLDKCQAVFTDSGGVQKEAYFFHKPCITLRDETEWIELVENGFNILVGADRDRIFQAERDFVHLPRDFSVPLYGDGKAGEKIISILANSLQSQTNT
jgi:UDP-GlcNAc3NAcA epimerase